MPHNDSFRLLFQSNLSIFAYHDIVSSIDDVGFQQVQAKARETDRKFNCTKVNGASAKGGHRLCWQ
jgi:hypothetical protein